MQYQPSEIHSFRFRADSLHYRSEKPRTFGHTERTEKRNHDYAAHSWILLASHKIHALLTQAIVDNGTIADELALVACKSTHVNQCDRHDSVMFTSIAASHA